MYWWNYKKLAVALREGTLTARQIQLYWCLFFLQIIGNAVVFFWDGQVHNGFIALLACFVCLILGVTAAINRSGDNKDYWNRFICLDLPITCRWAILFFPIALCVRIPYSIVRMLEICPESMRTDEAVMEACIIDNMPYITQATTVDFLVWGLGFMLLAYWYRNAFLYVSGKKPL